MRWRQQEIKETSNRGPRGQHNAQLCVWKYMYICICICVCVYAYAFKLLPQINSVVPLWERYLHIGIHTDIYILNFHAFRISFFI